MIVEVNISINLCVDKMLYVTHFYLYKVLNTSIKKEVITGKKKILLTKTLHDKNQ